jgi:hypothetical protein
MLVCINKLSHCFMVNTTSKFFFRFSAYQRRRKNVLFNSCVTKAKEMFYLESHEHSPFNFAAVVTPYWEGRTNKMAAARARHIPTYVSHVKIMRYLFLQNLGKWKTKYGYSTKCMGTWQFESNMLVAHFCANIKIKQNNLRGLSPRANYTDRETAACRRN